ncbi:MAG: T9SS type A sorting domain-containing protein [Crocinitomicaceae bacterium]|nr:T9SS type A sorting domain-containing protein [Crocinitomicaceae bacterium]
MKNFGVQKPCSEDWNLMSPTDKGAFCQKCATEVVDFTNKSTEEIKSTLLDLGVNGFCGRIGASQEQKINDGFLEWQMNSRKGMQRTMLFSLIVVFGLSMVSCTNLHEENTITSIQKTARLLIETEEAQKLQATVVERELLAAESLIHIEQIADEPEAIIEEILYLGEIRQTEQVEIMRSGQMMSTTSFTEYLEAETLTPALEERVFEKVICPIEFKAQVNPNPLTIEGELEITMPHDDNVYIQVYSSSGTLIKLLHEGKLERGTHELKFEMIDQQPGTYFVIIRSDSYSESIKFVKL